jgi:hypothetical protein
MVFFSLQHKDGKLHTGQYRMTLKEMNRTIRMIDHVHTRIVELLADATYESSRKKLERNISPSQAKNIDSAPTDLSPPRSRELSSGSFRPGRSRRYKSPLRGC